MTQPDSGGPMQTMSLRDWFAGVIVAGAFATARVSDREATDKDRWARLAYEFADALIRRRGG